MLKSEIVDLLNIMTDKEIEYLYTLIVDIFNFYYQP